MERLQKIIASRGVCSRRKAEELISAGKVLCNGQIAVLGDRADPEHDDIIVDGKALPEPCRNVYLMLYKPRGYVTTLSDEKGRRNAAQLVADCGCRVYPVGRLDMDSEGLLLFTNDGEFANMMMHPRKEVDKIYRVWVTEYTAEKLEQLKEPIELDGYRIRKPEVRLIYQGEEKTELEVTIHEGRNRQVRRMCEAAELQVKRLKRIGEGKMRLGSLKSGCWRYLSEAEVALLKNE